jgi:hypothetical protein
MINVIEINAVTGETTVTELTKKQIDDREAAAAALEAEKAAEAEAKATAKAALLDRLGITAEEAALLLG